MATNPLMIEISDDNVAESLVGAPAGKVFPHSLALWMAAFYMALFIIRPWEKLVPWLQDISFERIFAIVMIVIVSATRGLRLCLKFQTATVVLFLVCLGISGIATEEPGPSWNEFYIYSTLVVFYIVLISAIANPYELLFIASSYIVIMAVYLGKSQWEYVFNDAATYTMGVYRMTGIDVTLGQPNSVAISIVISLPIWLFLYSVRNDFAATWPKVWRSWFTRGLLIYLLLAAVSIILTNSRTGMVSAALFVGLVCMRGRNVLRQMLLLCAGMAFLLGVWLVMPRESQHRFQTVWDPSVGPANAQASAQGRIQGFLAGMQMCNEHPWTGVGAGKFSSYRVAHLDGIRLDAHNLVGQLLGETGILGASTFLLMVAAIVWNCRSIRLIGCKSNDATLKVLTQLAIAVRDSMLLLLLTGLSSHNIYRFNWLWLAAFGVLAADYALARKKELCEFRECAYEEFHYLRPEVMVTEA
jgi:O-antigen ligase